MDSFRNALTYKFDGIECDVRLSLDKKPVIIHDETLRRTHKRNLRVNEMFEDEFAKFEIPRLQTNHLKIILDLKEFPIAIINFSLRLCKKINFDINRIIFLVWEDIDLPIENAIIYRARGYKFPIENKWNGIACKYSGSNINSSCIDQTLSRGRSFLNVV